MISREEFAKAFASMVRKDLSTAEFARMAVEYMNSPEYIRWKAQRAAEDLKRWREGREHLMALIEAEQKAGIPLEWELIRLKDFDTVKVSLKGYSICFPSFLCKEGVDLNWTHVMEWKKELRRACGRADCGTSTSIDDETVTFGRGKLSDQGFWEFPCVICAEAFQKANPQYKVWPVKDAAQ